MKPGRSVIDLRDLRRGLTRISAERTEDDPQHQQQHGSERQQHAESESMADRVGASMVCLEHHNHLFGLTPVELDRFQKKWSEILVNQTMIRFRPFRRLGLRASGLGLRASGFGLQAPSGFGLRSSALGLRAFVRVQLRMVLPQPPRFDPSIWATRAPLIIGVAGGSGSGKTTIAAALVEVIDGVAYLKHDAYYRHRPALSFEERSRVNYDHPDSLETSLLVQHLERLRNGLAFEMPVYDFPRHLRSDEVVEIAPAPVVVVEGILVLADIALRDLMDLKVFVDTDPDLRLARRLERDIRERGRTVESVLSQYLETVRPMHQQFVEPSKSHADLIIPGGMKVGAVATIIELIRARMSTPA